MVLNMYFKFLRQLYTPGFERTFKKCVFGGVLSDVNYEYLLIMLCEIIVKFGFEVGWYFWNFKNFCKDIFFQKSVLFLGLEVVC